MIFGRPATDFAQIKLFDSWVFRPVPALPGTAKADGSDLDSMSSYYSYKASPPTPSFTLGLDSICRHRVYSRSVAPFHFTYKKFAGGGGYRGGRHITVTVA